MNQSELIDWFGVTRLGGVPLSNLLWGLLAACIAYLVLTTALRFAVSRAGKVAQHTATRIDDFLVNVLAGTNRWLILVASVLIGVGVLDLPDRWHSRVEHLWFLALAVQMGLWMNRAVQAGLAAYHQRHTAGSANPQQVSAAGTLMAWGASTLVWAVVLLSILANLGVNITAFVASLGVGGIAIALAVQNILGDLFASVSIAVDKPFEVGDFIVIGSTAGTVERIGLKTTRIRSLQGEQIVMSNTELLKQTINNYKRLQTRRIVFTFGITYDATPEQAEQVPGIVQRIVQASDRLKFDRAHFKGFGESSLDYEVVYIVQDPGFNVYMDEQQRINLALMRELAGIGVQFAFPTRTLIVQGPVPIDMPAGDGRASGGRGAASALN
ncbi:mechanosensitive ion channel family protein [Aquincola sp. J276]|uniref:mechanosensitive ion channel family protein n=1 Tax=Aquincola sp. J276 TaxID=2898432 RepID=UPI0021518E0F|nr:mechanosensitive ion channel family protein [Aquincola sp. J276]MCR5865026.1 mechanosensitive ion channel family protein [Aquincola sp. J276]